MGSRRIKERQCPGQSLEYAIAQDANQQNSDAASEKSELIQKSVFLQTAFDAIPDLISILDIDFKLVAVNKAYAEAIKKKPQELIGNKCYEIIHNSSQPIKECPHVQTLRRRHSFSKELFEPHLRKYFLVTASPIFSESGKILGTVHLMKNINGYKKAEKALQKSNQYYRDLVEVTSDFIWEVNKNGVYTYVSPKIYDILGYQPEEVLGKTPFDLMPPEEAQRISRVFKEYASQRKQLDSLQNINRHKDGDLFILETSGVPVYNNKGGFKGYRGMDRDITKRKQAEEALARLKDQLEIRVKERTTELAESEEKYRSVVDNTDELIVVFQEKIRFVNKRGLEITGYSEKELFSRPFTDFIHPADRDMLAEYSQRRANGEAVPNSCEFRIIHKDWSTKWLMLHAMLIQWHGKPATLGMMYDITERKLVEEALKASEEKYRSVVENASEAIAVTQDRKVKYFNPRLLEMTGYSAEDIKSKPFLDFVHPEDRKWVEEIYLKRIAGEEAPKIYEFRLVTNDGSTRWIRMNANLVTWEGRPATLNIFSDINDEKNLRDQLTEYAYRITMAQEEERKRVGYELHDDTAQYLSILKMQLGALSQSESIQDLKVKEKLQFLEKDADRAFNDVRRYSHELRPIVLEHQGLAAALEQMVEDYNKLGQLHISMNISGEEPDLPEVVKLGFFRIAQEALNNIRKHAKATQINIILNCWEDQLEMSVSDDGIGFDIRGASVRACDKGNLGLMSMRERAELIGASLNIESKSGQGTTVRAEIPLKYSQTDAQ